MDFWSGVLARGTAAFKKWRSDHGDFPVFAYIPAELKSSIA
jgi:hypothetical protein